jgi:hypothetical protein
MAQYSVLEHPTRARAMGRGVSALPGDACVAPHKYLGAAEARILCTAEPDDLHG